MGGRHRAAGRGRTEQVRERHRQGWEEAQDWWHRPGIGVGRKYRAGGEGGTGGTRRRHRAGGEEAQARCGGGGTGRVREALSRTQGPLTPALLVLLQCFAISSKKGELFDHLSTSPTRGCAQTQQEDRGRKGVQERAAASPASGASLGYRPQSVPLMVGTLGSPMNPTDSGAQE